MINRVKLLKFILVVLPLIAIIFPLWTLNVHPAFMGKKWIKIDVVGYGVVEGPIDSLNIANHYVGLRDVKPEEMIELKVLPIIYPLSALFMYMYLFMDERRSKIGKYLMFVVVVGIVLYFQYWLYRFGHSMDPELARIEIEPFTPYVVGYYKIANFEIFAYFNIGFFLLLIPLIVGIYIKRRYG